MFYATQVSKTTQPNGFVVRVKTGGASAAQTAAQGVSTAAQSAAVGVSNGVRQGVYGVRVWAAPRLENAADYTVKIVAPKVSAALRTSAQQVRPDQKRSRSMLTWSLVVTAVLATAGAVTAVVKYRDRAGTTTSEEEFAAGTAGTGTGATTGTEAPAQGASNAPADSSAGTDAGVNGRVSSSG